MEPKIFMYYKSNAIRSQEWFLKGKLHREDGPALIHYYKSGAVMRQEWDLNGNRHREDGPASIWYYESGAIKSHYYWWNGTQYPDIKTDEDWARKVPLLKIQESCTHRIFFNAIGK